MKFTAEAENTPYEASVDEPTVKAEQMQNFAEVVVLHEEPTAILPTEAPEENWLDIEVRTVPSMTDAGTEHILKQSQVEKKKLSHVESQTSLHLSSFKTSCIEAKPANQELNESLQTVMD